MTDRKYRIAIVSDAYFPQISGVATTIEATKKELEKMGHEILVISPRDFKFTVPLPGYSEIKLALFGYRRMKEMLDAFKPHAVHVSVEGPLGFAARRYCKKNKIGFSTAYHTRFPEYVKVRTGMPLFVSYAFLRWFHGAADKIMVASTTLKKELEDRGFKNIAIWSRGVDTTIFNPEDPLPLSGDKPIFMYMGRVAVEKGIDAFLSLDLPGTKYVVGDGPYRKVLEKKYPEVMFTGYKFGRELARHLAAADVFVFPSLTDTLGLVMLEANACGVPVAARPSQATNTVIQEGRNGYTSHDLKEACLKATKISREDALAVALSWGWKKPTEDFFSHLTFKK